jgi:hypothetical protein
MMPLEEVFFIDANVLNRIVIASFEATLNRTSLDEL